MQQDSPPTSLQRLFWESEYHPLDSDFDVMHPCDGSITLALRLACRGCRSEKAEVRALAGDRPRERGPAVVAPDDEDLEWQLLITANRDAGCAVHACNILLALLSSGVHHVEGDAILMQMLPRPGRQS